MPVQNAPKASVQILVEKRFFKSPPSHPKPKPSITAIHQKSRQYFQHSLNERASARRVWSSCQTASSILPHTPANPWRPNIHVQDCPWSSGIPHDVHLRKSNQLRATRPRLQVPPTEVLYTPSPICHSGCPILEEIVNTSSVKSFKTLMDAHWQPLFPEVPIPQPILSAHIDPRKNSHPNDTSHIPLPPHPDIYSSLYCFVEK